MKDSEFIELLNLYLDHEISAADAARLEAEVLANPARRTIYQDYCRMQKACKVLAKDFVDEGVPAAARNVVAFESARPSRGGWVATGAFAAVAACLAVVFVQETRQPAVTSQPAVATTEADTSNAMRSVTIAPAARTGDRLIPSTVSLPAGSEQPQARLVSALSLAGDRRAATPLVVASEQPGPQFDWMNAVQLSPIQRASLDEFRFDSRTPLRAENRPYMKRQPGQGPTEFNALRWGK